MFHPGLRFHHAAGAAVDVGFTENRFDEDAHSTYSFTSVSFGTAASDRIVVVAIHWSAVTTTGSISSVTIGGITATEIATATHSVSGATVQCALYAAAVPTGATGDVVVTLNETMDRCSIAAYRMVGASGVTPADTLTSTASPPSGGIDCPAGGAMIGGAAFYEASAIAWTGITEDLDQDDVIRFGSANLEFAATQTNLTITATPTGTPDYRAMAVASWGPA